MNSGRAPSFVVAAAILTAVGAFVMSGGDAAVGGDTAVAQLKTAAGRGTDADRAKALRDLAALDTTDSRAALSDLADAKDAQLAARACLTIGRADPSGGRAKLKDVFEDTARPHGVRVAAFLAWAKREAKDGASWDAIESYAKQHYQTGSPLESSVQAAKNALFPATSGEGR